MRSYLTIKKLEEVITTKQELLDTLEQEALAIAGEVVIVTKLHLSPNWQLIEKHLGNILDSILSLKNMDGIPSTLKKLEEEQDI